MNEKYSYIELGYRQNQFDAAYELYHSALRFEGNDIVQAPLLLAAAVDIRGGFLPLLDQTIIGIKFKEGFTIGRNGTQLENTNGVVTIDEIIKNRQAVIDGNFVPAAV